MESAVLQVGGLLLDPVNPRHEPVRAQDEAITAIIEEQGSKLVALMASIAEMGLSPADRMIVIPEKRSHIVVEGNRRIAALKLLDNPDLAADTAIERAVNRVAKERSVTISEVQCEIAKNRDEARPWILLRHDGESDGAGTVRWGARQAARFNARPGSQAAKALAFLEAVDAGYPDDEVMRELAEQVGRERLTTLGRLVADPAFRARAEFEHDDDEMQFHHDAAAMHDLIERVLRDLSGDYNVSQLKSKPQRETYIKKNLPKLKASTRLKSPAPLGEHPSKPSPEPKPKPKPKPKRPERLLKGLEIENLGTRIPTVLAEIQRIKVEDFPNAAGILLRVLLELSVDQVIKDNGWSYNQKFKERLRKVLNEVDPSGKDKRFTALRTGLQDGTSLYAVATLHSYVHNAYVHPTASDTRRIAANMADFLAELDDDLA
jgi:hypothetical protein